LVYFEIGPVIKTNITRVADVVEKFAKDPPFVFGPASEKFDELVAATVVAPD